jgi:hypothetical protein
VRAGEEWLNGGLLSDELLVILFIRKGTQRPTGATGTVGGKESFPLEYSRARLSKGLSLVKKSRYQQRGKKVPDTF